MEVRSCQRFCPAQRGIPFSTIRDSEVWPYEYYTVPDTGKWATKTCGIREMFSATHFFLLQNHGSQPQSSCWPIICPRTCSGDPFSKPMICLFGDRGCYLPNHSLRLNFAESSSPLGTLSQWHKIFAPLRRLHRCMLISQDLPVMQFLYLCRIRKFHPRSFKISSASAPHTFAGSRYDTRWGSVTPPPHNITL